MLGCWSSGLRPAPSAGAGLRVANGSTPGPKTIRPVKKAPTPIITAVAQGTTSRSLFRVM